MALLTYSSDMFRPGCHINYSSLHSPPPSLRPCPTAPSSPHKCFWKWQFFILMASVTAWCCAVRDARHSHRLEKYSFCAVRVLGWRGGAEKAEKQEGADRSGQEITLQQLHQGGAPNSFYPDQKSFYISFCPGQLIVPWSKIILHLILLWSTHSTLIKTHSTSHSALVNSFYPDQKSFYISFCPGQLFLPWSVQVILHQWSTQLLLTWSTQLILPWSAHFTTYSTLVRSFYNSFYHGKLILPWSVVLPCSNHSTLLNSFYHGQIILQLILPWSTHSTVHSVLVNSFYHGQLILPWSVILPWSNHSTLVNSFYPGQTILQLILPWSAHSKIHSTLVNSFYPGQTILKFILPWSIHSTLVSSFDNSFYPIYSGS